MTFGSVLEKTDWSSFQSKEGHGSSYKEGAQKEKTREREKSK